MPTCKIIIARASKQSSNALGVAAFLGFARFLYSSQLGLGVKHLFCYSQSILFITTLSSTYVYCTPWENLSASNTDVKPSFLC